MSEDCLQKELDFYQLPSLTELGVEAVDLSFAFREIAAKELVSRMLREIEAFGMKDMPPWDIIVYHRIANGRVDGHMNVLVFDLDGLDKLEHITTRGHNDFYTALTAPYTDSWRNVYPDRLVVKPKGTSMSYTVMLATPWLLGFLKVELDKYGLAVCTRNLTTVIHNGNNAGYNTFRLQYKHD